MAAVVARTNVAAHCTRRPMHPLATPHTPRSDHLEQQRYYCYCADATHALADTAVNPDAQSVTILDVGDFGWAPRTARRAPRAALWACCPRSLFCET